MLRKILIQNNQNKVKHDIYIMNILAGVISASVSIVLLMVITRTSGLYDAGVLSIAFAVAKLLLNFGKYGMRNYQTTDCSDDIGFASYFYSRVVTTSFMLLVTIGYLMVQAVFFGYTMDKILVIFNLCAIYASESIEDVFAGYYQKCGRLDVGSKMFVLRWSILLSVFIVIVLVSNNLLLAISVALFCSVCCVIAFSKCTISVFYQEKWNINMQDIKKLLVMCFPLFLTSFLNIYITNAPKYVIDKVYSEEIQACYGFISMPIFVITLFSGFLYQPEVVKLSSLWSDGMVREFRLKVRKQCFNILLISLFCIAAGYYCGIPVLSLVYGVDLQDYRVHLTLLLVSGGFTAIATFLSILLTMLRKQRFVIYAYLLVSILIVCSIHFVIQTFGLLGAVVEMAAATFLLFVVLYMAYAVFAHSPD